MAKKRIARRVGAAQKAKILATAKREGLTAIQVERKFGVSRWTYYAWRKRSSRGRRGRPANGRRRVAKGASARELKLQIAAMIPILVRAELAKIFAGVVRRRVRRAVRRVVRRGVRRRKRA